MICFLVKKEENACASFFHLNIKSLPKHYADLCILLESLSLKYSFVAITETWLNDHTNELYGMPNYTMESRYRKCKKGGGVALYVNDSIPYTVREDLEFFIMRLSHCLLKLIVKCFKLLVILLLRLYIECQIPQLMFLMIGWQTFVM